MKCDRCGEGPLSLSESREDRRPDSPYATLCIECAEQVTPMEQISETTIDFLAAQIFLSTWPEIQTQAHARDMADTKAELDAALDLAKTCRVEAAFALKMVRRASAKLATRPSPAPGEPAAIKIQADRSERGVGIVWIRGKGLVSFYTENQREAEEQAQALAETIGATLMAPTWRTVERA